MALPEELTTLARIAEQTEDDVAHLYQTYGDKFPEYVDFWSGLVMEQINHANMIHGLMNEVRDGLIKCSYGRVDCQAIESFQTKVQQEIIRAKRGQISAVEALAIALEIEKTLHKREYAEAFDEDSEKVRTGFSYLASSTQKRIKWIEQQLKPV